MDTLEPGVVTSNQDTYYGCVPLDKTNTVVIDGGAPATVVYTIRDASGNPIDLSKFFIQSDPNGEDNENGLFIKYSVADGTQVSKFVEQGYVLDAEKGKVQFNIPELVLFRGFYIFDRRHQ